MDGVKSRLTQEQGAWLLLEGKRDELFARYRWLILDRVKWCLRKYGLHRDKQDGLAAEALLALWEGVQALKPGCVNIAGFLSKVIKNKLLDELYANGDIVERGRKTSKRPRVFAESQIPRKQAIMRPARVDRTDEVSFDSSDVLENVEPESLFDFEDVLACCGDSIMNVRIVALMHNDGEGGRSPSEVARVVGISEKQVRQRLAQVEAKLYKRFDLRKPTGRRTFVSKSEDFEPVLLSPVDNPQGAIGLPDPPTILA